METAPTASGRHGRPGIRSSVKPEGGQARAVWKPHLRHPAGAAARDAVSGQARGRAGTCGMETAPTASGRCGGRGCGLRSSPVVGQARAVWKPHLRERRVRRPGIRFPVKPGGPAGTCGMETAPTASGRCGGGGCGLRSSPMDGQARAVWKPHLRHPAGAAAGDAVFGQARWTGRHVRYGNRTYGSRPPQVVPKGAHKPDSSPLRFLCVPSSLCVFVSTTTQTLRAL
jgi:hypothetical protein